MKRLQAGSAIRAGLLALALATGAHASFLFVDSGSHPLRYGDGFSLGSKFTVGSTNLEVTALGIYDVTGGGFFQSHEVGLWDVTAGNTQVADVTIPIGTSAVLLNGFRYIDVSSPVDLIAGDQYILAAFYPVGQVFGVNDQLLDCCGAGTNAGTSAGFGSFQAAFTTSGLGTSAGHLTEPNGTTAGTDYVGPNFVFVVVPEPSSSAVLGLGLIVLALRRRRA